MRKLRKLSEDELKQVLIQHELWLETGGIKGKRADLSDIDLSNNDLKGANLYYANQQFADLSGANLQDADLQSADLDYSDLSCANLYGANLWGADLSYADLRGAKFDHGVLGSLTLEGTKWLKTDIPWFIQHPDYVEWANTIEILDE